jgi:hypothetical protein
MLKGVSTINKVVYVPNQVLETRQESDAVASCGWRANRHWLYVFM